MVKEKKYVRLINKKEKKKKEKNKKIKTKNEVINLIISFF